MATSGTQDCWWLGGTPGMSGVSADPPASLIGAFAYDVTALCLCRLPLFTEPLSITQGWLLYAIPCPDSPSASLGVR